MNPTERMLLHLLDRALRGRAPDEALLAGVDWAALFDLAQAHKIDGLLLDAVCGLPEGAQPPMEVLMPWQEGAMMTMMGQALAVDQLHALLAAFEAAGIRAVALKGIVLKALYPQPDLRTMSDADLLVAEDDFGAACAVMAGEGFAAVEDEPGVRVFQGADGLRVELHQRLFDKAAYGFLSRLDEKAMFPLDKAERAPVYGGEAWTFPPVEHALFMLCHMAKHMITTGFGLRQTADFVLFAEANDAEMDWAAFWATARTLGLDAFASAVLGVGEKYMSLEAARFDKTGRHEGLPLGTPSSARGRWAEGAIDDPDAANALLNDLLDAGVFGSRTEERRRSAAVVYRAVDAKDGDAGRVRRALFPSATSLKAPYLYARKHPALLPVAWVHRFINYAVSLVTGKAKHRDTAASLSVADERLALLSRLGLRDGK